MITVPRGFAVVALAITCVLRGGAETLREPAPPTVSVVALPYFKGANAIWGSTGQDASGHLWFGVESSGATPNSAHLYEYDHRADAAVDRGNVVAELQRVGLWRDGEQQAKIHSRIVEGPGGFVYFASMDEHGEKDDGSVLPTWGGHLWRMSLSTHRWEHLLRTPEALIAVAAGGRFVYTLGYFGHVLYQFDTQTRTSARLVVGSIDGHISRNFLVDGRGHAYVPRLTAEPAATNGARRVTVTMAEINTSLKIVRETPIDTAEYLGPASPTSAHGIIGVQPMTDGTIYFTTHAGRLFHIVPPAPAAVDRNAPATVVSVGWFHPAGPAYTPSLFTSNGTTALAGLVRRANAPWEWVSCEMPALRCSAAALTVTDRNVDRGLLYGSSTRDADGGHYIVGVANGPVVLRVQGAAR